MEHRWGRRVPVGRKIRLATREQDIAWGYLRDVSISGAFIETPAELAPFASLVVYLQDPTVPGSFEGDLPLLLAGVVRIGADGVGVEWEELAPASVTALLESLPSRPAANRRPPAEQAQQL